jgi:aminotransferase
VGLAGGKTVFAPTYENDNWVLTARNLRAAITGKTKMLILNYPNNPTGSTMTSGQYAAIAQVLNDTDILVVSDEIYAEFVFEGSHNSILHQPSMRKRTILVSGFSKSMAMTGWRLGYLCAPKDLLVPVDTINAATVLCASGIAQAAACRGLDHGRKDIDFMTFEYRARRDYMVDRAGRIGWISVPPNGAFYLWANISSTGIDADRLVRELIEKCNVALIPGTVFGTGYKNFVRITFSSPIDILKEAMDRIDKLFDDSAPINHSIP